MTRVMTRTSIGYMSVDEDDDASWIFDNNCASIIYIK